MSKITDADIAALMDMFGEEDLHPDLVPYVDKGRTFGECLHHPLIIEVLYRPEMHKRYNKMYQLKRAEIAESISTENWAKFVFLHERPYRIDALIEVMSEHDVPQEKLWSLIGNVWTDSENIRQNLDEWREIWDGAERGRNAVMNEAEIAALKALPNEITVYRGFAHKDADQGISWTTDRNRALWFAKRFEAGEGRTPMLATGRVNKIDVLAHFLGRNETEIVVMPESVEDMEIMILVDDNSEIV